MSLAESVLQTVETTAQREGARRVSVVVLEIGQLASVEPEALQFCFAAVTRGTMAQEARLEIIELPGRGWCAVCAASVAMDALYGICPLCGVGSLQPSAGTEMRVKEIEIE